MLPPATPPTPAAAERTAPGPPVTPASNPASAAKANTGTKSRATAPPEPTDEREEFRRLYKWPDTVQILEANRSGDTWTAKVRCKGSILPITQMYQHAYGEAGYMVQTAHANVVRSAGHVTLVMTKGSDQFELYADQDEQDHDLATLRVRGGMKDAPGLHPELGDD